MSYDSQDTAERLGERSDGLLPSEQRYRNLIQSFPSAVVVVQDGVCVFANAAAGRLYALQSDQRLVGMLWTDTVDDDFKPAVARRLANALNGNANPPVVFRVRRPDGVSIDLESESFPFELDGGPAVMIVQHDITERRRIDNALRESEERFRRVFELGLIGMAITSQDKEWVIVNDRLCRILGYPREELTQKTWAEITHAEDVEADGAQFDRVMAGEIEGYTMEKRFIRKDGAPIHTEIAVKCLRRPDGSLDYFMALVQDITERMRARAARQHELEAHAVLSSVSAELLASKCDIGQIAQLILEHARKLTGSRHGYVSAIDPATGENVGYTLTEMAPGECSVEGRRIAFPPGPDGRYPGLWGHALNSLKSFYTNDPREDPHFKGLPAGHVPIERFLTVPVVTANRPVGQIALANPGRDYTDQDLRAVERLGGLYGLALQRHRMEQEREKLQNQLLRVQKLEAVGTLARGIAHDFNNILGAILGHSQMIPERLRSGQDVAENAEQISKACLRARDLVRQILSFSRNGNPERRPINIGHIVKEALKLVQSSVNGFIDVRYLIPVDIDPAMADPSQVHQVVMNLCTNARDAMEEKGGTLEVSLAHVDLNGAGPADFPDLPPGRYARLLVRDTGDGMDKATLAQIFDPFFTTKEVGKGTGLGLAVVHGIVKSHGGGIAVSSSPGQGTTFNIMLPLMEKSAGPDDEPGEPVVKGSGRVLIVDDEKGLAQIVERMLVYLGYQAVSRTCPQEALDLFKKDPRGFDLLLTDLTMPVMTGERLAGEVRAIRPDLPVIICTGYGEQTVQLKLARFGDAQVLLKPVELHDLASALRRALARPAGS